MRYFGLLGVQDIILFVFPTLVFVILLYTALSRSHFRGKGSEEREKRVVRVYPDGIEVRNSPFPLILILVIVGFLLWGFLYALVVGMLGVKI